jgi:hypothetical protein
MATKLLAAAQRYRAKDFIDVVELVRQGVNLQEGFQACLHLAEAQGISHAINLEWPRNDFMSKTVKHYLPNPEDVLVLNVAAKEVDLEAVFHSKASVMSDMHTPSADSAELLKKKRRNPQSLNEFIAEILWYDDPNVFQWKNHLLIFVLSMPPSIYHDLVDSFDFSQDDFVEAMLNAPPGYFKYNERGEWLRWNRFFKIDPPAPFPDGRPRPGPRLIPIDRDKFPVLPGDVLWRGRDKAESRRPRPENPIWSSPRSWDPKSIRKIRRIAGDRAASGAPRVS